jgi:hypothetical protein
LDVDFNWKLKYVLPGIPSQPPFLFTTKATQQSPLVIVGIGHIVVMVGGGGGGGVGGGGAASL